MKKVQEEEKRKGRKNNLKLDWDLIMNKIEELQVTQDEADKIKKAILHREGEHMRMMYISIVII